MICDIIATFANYTLLADITHRYYPNEVDSHFFVVSYRGAGNDSYQEIFLLWKNIVSSQSYRILKSWKYIQLHCDLCVRPLIAISQQFS